MGVAVAQSVGFTASGLCIEAIQLNLRSHMKEHAVILIWRQSEIWAAAIIIISFINDISIRILLRHHKLVLEVRLLLYSSASCPYP